MKNLILDTNAFTAFLSGDPISLDALAMAETIQMSVIVLGELYSGFRGGRKQAQNLGILDQFLRKPTVRVLPVTKETSEVFGQIKRGLQTVGSPIPINDVWIAAQAIETGSVVATYDRHFTRIPGLRLWDAIDS